MLMRKTRSEKSNILLLNNLTKGWSLSHLANEIRCATFQMMVFLVFKYVCLKWVNCVGMVKYVNNIVIVNAFQINILIIRIDSFN